jgi:phage terminase large subunit-like protein
VAASLLEQIAALPEPEQAAMLDRFTEAELEALYRSWILYARPEQLAPDWMWRVWLLLTGRGFGKTRTGAEWVADRCETFAKHNWPHLIGLMNKTNDDVRSIQLHGESGLGAVAERRGHILEHTGSSLHGRYGVPREDGTTHWSNIEVHTGMDPDRCRGRNFHTVWADELASWKHKIDNLGNTAFTNADFSLRARCPPGEHPRCVVTTTPKPVPQIRALVKGDHGPTAITEGSMLANASNLPPSFIEAIVRRYGGTRLGAQEIEGALLDAVEGALWNPEQIDRWRVKRLADVPDLSMVVVGVDPSGSEGGDECGILTVGMARERDHLHRPHVYVLEDASVQNRPAVWAPRVLGAVDHWGAQAVVAETNFGGKLVVDTLTLRRPGLRVEEVRASVAKRVRAEPVSTIYETGQVHHVGYLPILEEQQCTWTPFEPTSPDRMDALVWAITWLIPDLVTPPADFAKGWADRSLAT